MIGFKFKVFKAVVWTMSERLYQEKAEDVEVVHFYAMPNCSASREVSLKAQQWDTTQKTAAMWAGPDIGGVSIRGMWP